MINIENNFFKNKLARRFLVLFIVVIFIPITVTVLVSYLHVSSQLRAQSYEQLRQSSKALGLEFYRRLTVVRNQMQEVRKVVSSQDGVETVFTLLPTDSLFPDISGLARVSYSGDLIDIGSEFNAVPNLSRIDLAALQSDRAAFVIEEGLSGQQHHFLILRIHPEEPESDLLIGQVSPEYLFSVDQLLSDNARLIILDASDRLYYSSLPEAELNEFRGRFNAEQASTISGGFNWNVSGQVFLASYFSVFTDTQLTTPYFSIVINQPEREALAPLTNFRNSYVPGLLLVMLLISLVAVSQINKKLAPLALLRDATRRIASGDFDTRVEVNSDDEIGQLQGSFNSMAEGLDRFLRARDNAQAANKAKTEFLSSMSHELRTPLNAIIGLSELLDIDQAGKSIENQSEYPKEIMKAGYHLLDLIDDVLDLSRIEAGHLKLEIEPVSIPSITSECVKQMNVGLASKQGIAIDDRTSKEGLWVSADKKRLTQVIFNLLSNAVKYNRSNGTVVIDSHKLSKDKVRITVTDSGYGIAPEYIDKLFDPFERLAARKSSVEGSGIGLTVVRDLVDAMHGEIGVNSKVDRGSTFWVDLPLASIVSAAQQTPKVIAPSPLGELVIEDDIDYKVLYIEDTLTNVMVVKGLLKKWENIQFLNAETAEEGLKLAEQELPDLILMDICLPGIDGYAALKILRSSAETRHIPVVALTANAMESDLQSGKDVGFDAYLTKPINISMLLKEISKHINKPASVA